MTGHSVPIPTTARDVSDHFTGVLVGAPDFVFLNSCVRYRITLDMMMDALAKGISNVMRRTKSTDALKMYEECQAEVSAIHELYRNGELDEARRRIQLAQFLFQRAGKRKLGKAPG